MAPFPFLRRLSSLLFGWERSERPAPAESLPRSEAPAVSLAALLAGEGALPSPKADKRVARLEERYFILIPDDFRRYLLNVAPLADVVDDEMTTWWSLDRVTSLPDGLAEVSILPPKPSGNPDIAAEEDAYLLFADYMIWCWGWAVCCSNGPNRGRVAMIGDREGFVADSFDEFVRRYLLDPGGMANTFPKE